MDKSDLHASLRASQTLPMLERGAALALFLVVTIFLVRIKLNHVDQQFGDTASFLQILENLAFRGQSSNQVLVAVVQFLTSGETSMTAAKLSTLALTPQPVPFNSIFSFHSYGVLYPMAALVRLFPSIIVLETLYVVSFTATLLLAYVVIRQSGIPVLGAALFCLLVASHPAWATGMQGQFYPDRLFIFCGLLLMLGVHLASGKRTGKIAVIAATLLCCSIDERTAITAGICLIGFALLFWEREPADRWLSAGAGVAAMCYGAIMVKYFLPGNFYNAGFLPSNLAILIGRFQDPVFRNDAIIFAVVNCGLWTLSWLEWRAALIAFVMMLPNIVGNIGGAEKLGWSSHYPDEYLPILIWAALLGFIRGYRITDTRFRRGAFLGAVIAMIAFFTFIDPATATFSTTNANNTFIAWFDREAPVAFSPVAQQGLMLNAQMQQAVPEDSVVTTVEGGMTPLYRTKTIDFFPIGIDQADFAVLGRSGSGAAAVYSGIVNFLGPAETDKANKMVVARMKRDGYDFDHPIFDGPNGVVIVKRLH